MSKRKEKLIFNSVPELYDAALHICRILNGSGGQAYFVGGCVRDAVCNNAVKDFDIECYGLSGDEIKEAVGKYYALNAVGMSFGVLKIHHFDIDISLPRKENKTGSGHRGFIVECVPQLTLREASARRDFTINAMLYDPLTEELTDLWGGCNDLQNKVLRHISERFSEDPLRVLRAMQFASRFDFSVAPETVLLCSEISRDELSCERIACEWEKMLLQGVKISKGLEFLKASGWIASSPELEETSHDTVSWQKLLYDADMIYKVRTGDKEYDLLVAVAVICSFFKNAGDTDNFIRRIWNFRNFSQKVIALIKNVDKIISADCNITDAQLRRAASECNGAGHLLDILSILSSNECGKLYDRAENTGILYAPPRPLVSSNMLLKYNILPGKEMGEILKCAFEAQLDGEFADVAGAEVWLRKKFTGD